MRPIPLAQTVKVYDPEAMRAAISDLRAKGMPWRDDPYHSQVGIGWGTFTRPIRAKVPPIFRHFRSIRASIVMASVPLDFSQQT